MGHTVGDFMADNAFSKMRASLSEALLWAVLIAFTIVGLRIPPSTQPHGFLYGRFPYSDGAAWVIGTIGAASGKKQRWVTRRPLNVPLNAATLWLAKPVFKDPVVGSLAIKRSMAIASIAALVGILRKRWGNVARLGLGITLLSVLFAGPIYALSKEFFVVSVGYNYGSELNSFIFVTLGVALLLSTLYGWQSNERPKRHWMMFFSFLTLSVGVLMRPGPLLLMPLLIAAAILVVLAQRMKMSSFDLNDNLRACFSILLCGLLAFTSTLAVERILFNRISDSCGAIGGNQGYTLYGMSVGGGWADGAKFGIENYGQPVCERSLNQILKQHARKNVMRDPRPLLTVLKANVNGIVYKHISLLRKNYALSIGALLLFTYLVIKSFAGKITWSDQLPAILMGAFGLCSILLFLLLFYSEAYFRPTLPFSVFPSLAIFGILNALLSAKENNTKLRSLALQANQSVKTDSGSMEKKMNSLAMILSYSFMALTAAGMIVVFANGLEGGHQKLIGSIQISKWEALDILNTRERIQGNYSLKSVPFLSDIKHEKSTQFCLQFTRDRLPRKPPYGEITGFTAGPCQEGTSIRVISNDV